MKPNLPKLIFALLVSIYFIWYTMDPIQGSFLDYVNLPIHEAGDLFFCPFVQFISVVAASLFQVLVSIIFVVYFWWHNQRYSSGITLFWVGQSIINLYVYAADAVVMQIVLLGGLTGSEGSFHDWMYLLTETALFDHTYTVVKIIRTIGSLTILSAIILSMYYSFQVGDD